MDHKNKCSHCVSKFGTKMMMMMNDDYDYYGVVDDVDDDDDDDDDDDNECPILIMQIRSHMTIHCGRCLQLSIWAMYCALPVSMSACTAICHA